MSIRRTIGDAALIGIGAAALVLGRLPLLVVMAVLTVLAAGEMYRQARVTGAVPVAVIGLAGAVSLLYVAHIEGEDATIFFPIVVAAVLGLGFLAMIARPRRGTVTDGVALTIVPLVAVGLFAAYVIALRSARDGFRVVVALTLMAVVNDLVSGLVDPRRGRRALAPTVRPSRTWEGLAAGAVATLAVATVLAVVFDTTFSVGSALVIGVLVAAAAPLGDLARAMFERDLRAEAAPGTVPRAAVLRRIDGLLFAAPVFYYAFRALER